MGAWDERRGRRRHCVAVSVRGAPAEAHWLQWQDTAQVTWGGRAALRACGRGQGTVSGERERSPASGGRRRPKTHRKEAGPGSEDA